MQAKIWHHSEWIKETNPATLKTQFDKLLKQVGFNVLNVQEHHFKPYGYTALWLLSESHFAIHTFPECGKSYIEISSCNIEYYQKFISAIKNIE